METRGNRLFVVLAVAGLSSCAATVPSLLVDARAAYAASSAGPAATLTPADLYDARKSLDLANVEFEKNGDTAECRDYAYIAERKVELADAKARTEQDRQRIAEAIKAGVAVRDNQVKNSQAALESTREVQEAQGKELEKTQVLLDAEKERRLTAEGRLAGAMKDLVAIASVKEESRGVVITLSGSVLFPSGKYALLDTAKIKLDQVAEALKAQDANKRMVVEGHTDSKGSDATNQALSLNRANAVRSYLVSRGVAADRITAVGLSSTRPLVDNSNAENRANNRRVEIVIGEVTNF